MKPAILGKRYVETKAEKEKRERGQVTQQILYAVQNILDTLPVEALKGVYNLFCT